MTLPVARGGRTGRHLIVFRIVPDDHHPTVDVLRILHESMDLPRHLTDDEIT
ncbi:plasmid stabilization system protein ParE [Roseospira visakhapatnamensis]|uniref:Plasmid stabilization system protein ParE n=2 Tax=Roseospira visakhapatnamensis TaxID=390880 RepID=A0A7W6RD49_9PROT|nr:plasmid stabilization system protein ParE [Roseospira visakhapatnamensis]